ncbi:unnamed protein product [Eruca vesicaria subsp. sativa]|uniref:Uncharacterized protein n=1 Tax=Eruca vesicaria subsp. sativa TaxID=29727 RepID=A0ABC8JWB9_ERUVS|nr:unnamed protein product [Eruca vesicaria subsp. sativa]
MAKKAESDAATMEPTTGKATVAEEAPGAGAGDSMVAEVMALKVKVVEGIYNITKTRRRKESFKICH